MAESAGQKAALIAGGDVSSPARTIATKRQPPLSQSRQKSTAYCAHAPEPYAAMASRGDWSTELWDIFAQPGGANMCCLSLWCPCIQYGLILEQLPPSSVTCAGSVAGGCALFGVLWLLGDVLSAVLITKVVTLPCTALVHSQTRGYMRRKYGIQSHPIHDFFITWCCAPCALCQEARETVIRQAAEREDLARPSVPSRAGSIHGLDPAGRNITPGRASGASAAVTELVPRVGLAAAPGLAVEAIGVVPLAKAGVAGLSSSAPSSPQAANFVLGTGTTAVQAVAVITTTANGAVGTMVRPGSSVAPAGGSPVKTGKLDQR